MIARDTNRPGIGSALITMVEPHPGYERAYNRWYEDDHHYSDAMMGPWMYAGARWVAPRELRERRVVVPDPLLQSPLLGCYVSTFWVAPEQELNHQRWAFLAMAEVLGPAGRGFAHRDHIYTSRHLFRSAVLDGNGPMQPMHALDAGFAGLQLEVIDAPDAAALPTLEAELTAELIPDALKDGRAAMALIFAPVPFTQGVVARRPVPGVAGDGRLTLLWFLRGDPLLDPAAAVSAHHARLHGGTRGALRFSGCFVPTHVGTDDFVDQLR